MKTSSFLKFHGRFCHYVSTDTIGINVGLEHVIVAVSLGLLGLPGLAEVAVVVVVKL